MGIIYCATNLMNGKQYVGQSIAELDVRRNGHENDARKKKPSGCFHHALKKYGPDAFTWEVLIANAEYDEIDFLEIYFIEKLGTFSPNGYNMTLGGGGFSGGHTEEAKKKISAFVKGRPKPAGFGEHLSRLKKGKTWEEIYGVEAAAEMRKRRSEARKGKTFEEMFGPEKGAHARASLLHAAQNQVCTPETRKKLSEKAIQREARKRESKANTSSS